MHGSGSAFVYQGLGVYSQVVGPKGPYLVEVPLQRIEKRRKKRFVKLKLPKSHQKNNKLSITLACNLIKFKQQCGI